MPDGSFSDLKQRYDRDGFVTGIPVLDEREVVDHRAALENAEAELGHSLHYGLFPNLIFSSPNELMHHPKLIKAVEAVLGPDLIAYEVSYIIKEAGNEKRVSWHQDLTYWGLDTDDVVTAWLALSPATEESGCMRMIPGSHRIGKQKHEDLREDDNILARGQTIPDVDESTAVSATLASGEMSLHHGWVMHASQPNMSEDRRIGFSIVFIRPSVRQNVQARECAALIQGEDKYGYYDPLPTFTHDFDPALMATRVEIDRRRNETWQTS